MKLNPTLGLLSLLAASPLSAQSLYDVGADGQESSPLKWSLGVNFIYDDNVTPGVGSKEDSFAANPFVGASFTSVSPQTTIDLYARLGLIYYFDAPASMDDDVNSQSRLGLNITHNVSERLRLSSRNFISYELEPDYSYGYATSRVADEYLYWQSDNSVGFRWSERFGTYTGVRVGGLEYDGANSDTTYVEPYNQFRYQLTPQTVLTAEYRYRWTTADGLASDSTDQYILVGAEHRFTPTTLGAIRMGAQLHDVENGDRNTSPYLEASLRAQTTEQFSIRGFARYGYENYDVVFPGLVAGTTTQYDERATLRLGISGEYAISPRLSVFSGIDYITTRYQSGRAIVGAPATALGDEDENIFNTYLGFSVKLTDYLFGNVSYNFTNSSSDLAGRDYDRSRINVGLSAEF